MICNPVIQGGGAEKVYKIDDNTTSINSGQSQASAGERIGLVSQPYKGELVITDSLGNEILYFGLMSKCYFIMPASDVTLRDIER